MRHISRAAAALVACALTLTACGTSSPPAPTSAVAPAAPGMLVMVIRHGEKPSGSEPGLDAQGNVDSHGLTRTGWDRANHLVDLFAPAGTPRAGIARPATIYAAAANNQGDGLRTRETVTPLADHLGVRVDTDFGKGQEQALVDQAVAGRGPVLISWQHGEIPVIASAFPGVSPTPPTTWPNSRFDVVWTFTRTATGWHFAQLPERVLPGDSGSVIAG